MYTKNHNHIRYSSWDMEWDRMFVIFDQFLPFHPPNNPQNQNFEKMKKASGGVIILHMCTKNQDHMIYPSWDVECDKQIFLSFWAMFCSFATLLTPKIKIWKKHKKPGYIIFLYMCTINQDHFFYLHIYTIKTKKYNHQVHKYQCTWDPSKKRLELRTKNGN